MLSISYFSLLLYFLFHLAKGFFLYICIKNCINYFTRDSNSENFISSWIYLKIFFSYLILK